MKNAGPNPDSLRIKPFGHLFDIMIFARPVVVSDQPKSLVIGETPATGERNNATRFV